MITALLLAGLSAIALGAALLLRASAFQAGLLTQAAGVTAVGLAGLWTLGSANTWGAGFASTLDPRFGVDGLSGLFLGTLGLVAVPALLFSLRYLQPTRQGRLVGALSGAFVLALALVLCARDPRSACSGDSRPLAEEAAIPVVPVLAPT